MESERSRLLLTSGLNPQLQPTMATLSDRLPLNVAGRFFVDSSCIDCDQCRVEAPEFFARDGDHGTSYVMKQPVTAEEIAAVESAAANCATGSIGDETAG